ncbi:MoaA/NifB/PqqE/SkfB family radical SAM enzyme [Lachnospiraceae bacterium PF1-21]
MGKIIKSIGVQINDKCNLKCEHCVAYESEVIRQELELKDLKKIIKKLKFYGLQQVAFILKEPMVYKDIIDAIEFCNNRDMETEIITNGTLLNEEKIFGLIEAGLTSLNISLEGISSESNDLIRGIGTFNTVIDNLELFNTIGILKERFIPIILKMTLNSYSVNEVEKMPLFFQKLNVNEVRINTLFLQGKARDNPQLMLSKEKAEKGVEKLLIAYKSIDNPKYTLVISSMRPLAYIYYNLKYSINLMVSYTSCMSDNEAFSLSDEGIIYSCADNKKYIIKENNEYQKIPNCDLLDNSDIESFLSENKLFHLDSKNSYNMKEICEECGFNDKCQPCGLKSYEEVNTFIKDCAYYREKIEKLIRKKTRFGKGIRITLKESAYIVEDNMRYKLVNSYQNGRSIITYIKENDLKGVVDRLCESMTVTIEGEANSCELVRLLLTDCFLLS